MTLTKLSIDPRVLEGDIITKARLCVRGDQELDVESIATDSPTVAKLNIRIILMAASRRKDWSLNGNDVQSAFLQSAPIERTVYVNPPRESGLPREKVWKLKKSVYGLLDASWGF